MSLLQNAKEHCDKYPSVAVDSGTEQRSTIQLLTRMLNNLSASSEYSGTQACATALGLPANFCMHKKCFLFADHAIEYIKDCRLRLSHPDLEPDDGPSEASSFSSGVYSTPPSDYSDSDDSVAQTDTVVSTKSAEPVQPDVHPKSAIPAPSTTSASLPTLTEEEEFGAISVNDDGMEISDTDSDVELETNQRVENLLRRGAIQCGSVPLMRNAAGKLCIVQQAEDYRFRHEALADFSLYELVCTSYRREIQRKRKKTISSDSSGSESDEPPAETSRRAAGRQPDKLFNFQDAHQLKDTHALALLKKFSVAHFIKKVPAYPGPRLLPLTEAWKGRARIFAEFALVVFKPWQGPNGLPLSTTWRTFCDWMLVLRQSDTIIDRTRAAFVRNAAHNLKFSSNVSKLLKRFRGSAATRWLEMALHLRPRKWLYGDEITLEKDLKSKNNQREAELAMRDLLHRVCDCSPSETKKAFLIAHTVNAYRNAIEPNLSNLQGVKSLFQNDVPVLWDRINCFTVATVERVRDHNLKKQAERLLQSKLQQNKYCRSKKKTKTTADVFFSFSRKCCLVSSAAGYSRYSLNFS